jgi:hypothetical protein
MRNVTLAEGCKRLGRLQKSHRTVGGARASRRRRGVRIVFASPPNRERRVGTRSKRRCSDGFVQPENNEHDLVDQLASSA